MICHNLFSNKPQTTATKQKNVLTPVTWNPQVTGHQLFITIFFKIIIKGGASPIIT